MSDGTEQKEDVDYSNLIRAQTRQVDIDAFKERGMKKVNVINAKKINELISQAVTNIIGKMEDADIETIKEDKAQIVMDSMSEFKRLFADHKKEKDEQERLQEELRLLRESMATGNQQAASEATSLQMQQVSDEIAELKAFMINQASKAQSQEMTRAAMMEQQADLLEDHFNDLKATLATSGGGTTTAEQTAIVSDENTKKALEGAVERITELLEKQDKERNGTTLDALVKALTEFKEELGEKFDGLAKAVKESVAAGTDSGAAALKEAITSLRDDLKNANTESLKAEIAALREDLAEKTIAAGAANTEALTAQLAKMEEKLEKGGGGGGAFSGDLSEIVSKLEGSMSKKLAEAGIGREEVSADDSVAASGVMLGAAFKGMDDIESNIEGLDARKSVDKAGGKKAKSALDALKKFKKGGG
jgi:hypothetical protein